MSMTREIKFRAWDRSNKAMLTRFDIDGEGTNQIRDIRIGFQEIQEGRKITTHTDDVILMQFTGLLDKNGKEIYEGDIVKYIIENSTAMRIGTVEWCIAGWIVNAGMHYSDWSFCNQWRVEIIGNIYENSDLLS